LINDLEEKALEKTEGCRCKSDAEPQDMNVAVETKIRGTWEGVKATQITQAEI